MNTFTLEIMPGICRFACTIRSSSEDRRTARIDIIGSDCSMVRQLAATLTDLSVRDIFTPLTQNKVFLAAERAGCHLACPVPVAVVKAAEAALVLALPEDVHITFSG